MGFLNSQINRPRGFIQNRSQGNVLFLILIAVALFAALSYAVVSSSRTGNSNISQDQARILASQLVSELNRFKSGFDRLYASGDYAQVLFSSVAENTNGIVYVGADTTGRGRTIGLFNSDAISLPKPSYVHLARHASFAADTRAYEWFSRDIKINGIELGTDKPDEVLRILFISDLVCQEINRQLSGINTIPSYSDFPAVYGTTFRRISTTGTETSGSNPSSVGQDLPDTVGCFKAPTNDNHFWMVVKAY